MFALLITNVFLFIICINAAVLEIQTEGQHGWAGQLPTWRPSKDKWYSKVYMQIMAGKELTGYHLAVFSLFFLVFHIPYFYGYPFNLENWGRTLSLYFLLAAVWDFLWFSLNPHYPIANFRKGGVPWHTKWIGRVPTDYLTALGLSFVVLIPSMVVYQTAFPFEWWLLNVFLFLIQSWLLTLFAVYCIKIDDWKLH